MYFTHSERKVLLEQQNSERFAQSVQRIANTTRMYFTASSIKALEYLADNLSQRNAVDFLDYLEKHGKEYCKGNTLQSGKDVAKIYKHAMDTRLI